MIGDAVESIYSILSSPGLLNKEKLKADLDDILFACGRKRDEHLLIKRASYHEWAEEFHENITNITNKTLTKFLASTGIQL